MTTSIVKANFPAASAGVGVSGKRLVLFVNYGENASEASPVWNKVGGVEENNFNVSLEAATTQTKDSGYWSEGGVTGKSAELSASIIAKRDDVGQLAIEHFVMDDETTAEKRALNFALVDIDTLAYKKFWAIPTSWETTAASDDLLRKSLSATVTGAPTEATGFVIPT